MGKPKCFNIDREHGFSFDYVRCALFGAMYYYHITHFKKETEKR